MLLMGAECWALCFSAIMKKKLPAQEVLWWAFFDRWARNFFGYRQVLNPTLAGIFCAHFPENAHEVPWWAYQKTK